MKNVKISDFFVSSRPIIIHPSINRCSSILFISFLLHDIHLPTFLCAHSFFPLDASCQEIRHSTIEHNWDLIKEMLVSIAFCHKGPLSKGSTRPNHRLQKPLCEPTIQTNFKYYLSKDWFTKKVQEIIVNLKIRKLFFSSKKFFFPNDSKLKI